MKTLRAMLFAVLPIAWLGVAAVPAAGEEVGSDSPLRRLVHSSRLAGDPGGARSRLAENGLTLELFGNYFLGTLVHGGREGGGAWGHSGTLDLFARADLEALGVVPDAEILFHAKSSRGRNVNPEVGALSDPFDDADFDEGFYVAELWIQKYFFADRVWLRAGYIDQQTAFDRNAFANSEDRQFMATFLDNDPVVPLEIGLGAALFVRPVDWLVLVAAAADADNDVADAGFDTAFDDAASLTANFEADFRIEIPSRRGSLPGHLRIGAFYDGTRKLVFGSRSPERPDGDLDRGHPGVYMSWDQVVHREAGEGAQGLGLFARYGWADADVNRITRFWSVGLEYCGLVPGRDEDVLGLGAYGAIGSDRHRRAVDPEAGDEVGIEVTYRIQATPWLAVAPDFQFIHDPGGSSAGSDAFVLGLRVRVAL